MSLRDKATAFARTHEVLWGHEMERAGEFIDLFVEILQVLAADEQAPTAMEFIVARSIATMIWKYDRETGDAEALRRLVLEEPSYNLGRQNAFRDIDSRVQMQRLYAQGVREAMGLLKDVREAVAYRPPEVNNVLPMKQRKKR